MGSVTVLVLVLIGVLTGLTTVLFGFGGGFVTVPVIVWADAALGPAAGTVAVATSAIVMVVNAAVATTATPRMVLARLRGRGTLLGLLAGLLGALAAMAVPGDLPPWGFVIYVAITIIDVLVRPGFLRPADLAHDDTSRRAVPTAAGAPIGAVASFLGVGGSVMTVPLLRRAGLPMAHATSLANPLTLAISVPAALVFLLARHTTALHGAVFGVGIVDLGAAALLLIGAIPVIVILRRRPPHIPDRVHAWAYITLLVVALLAMAASLLCES